MRLWRRARWSCLCSFGYLEDFKAMAGSRSLLAIYANIMQRILGDSARARSMDKRGSAAQHVNPDDAPNSPQTLKIRYWWLSTTPCTCWSRFDPRKAKVAELNFFGGLDVEETSEVLKISPQNVMRDWKMARVWLVGELAQSSACTGRAWIRPSSPLA